MNNVQRKPNVTQTNAIKNEGTFICGAELSLNLQTHTILVTKKPIDIV